MAEENIGIRIARHITVGLAGKVGIPFNELEKLVYDECRDIVAYTRTGDWLEMPDGTTYTLTFKPPTKY